jgi:hypothetical protein
MDKSKVTNAHLFCENITRAIKPLILLGLIALLIVFDKF